MIDSLLRFLRSASLIRKTGQVAHFRLETGFRCGNRGGASGRGCAPYCLPDTPASAKVAMRE